MIAMDEQPKIDKGVPIPKIAQNSKWGFLKLLEAGDSIFIPGESSNTVSSNIAYYVRKLGIQICTRTVVEDGVKGCRLWRTH